MISKSYLDRFLSLGVWAWLEIVEKEKDKLSDGGQVALELLRQDLEKLSEEKD